MLRFAATCAALTACRVARRSLEVVGGVLWLLAEWPSIVDALEREEMRAEGAWCEGDGATEPRWTPEA